MAERPVLFSGSLVRAILEGRKTQTRRPVKPEIPIVGNGKTVVFDRTRCPLGVVGDRLWVREAWTEVPWLSGAERRIGEERGIRYRATWDKAHSKGWKPSIHMKREASRITLEVTDVRVQRLQDLTEEDAIAEGMVFTDHGKNAYGQQKDGWSEVPNAPADRCLGTARYAFGNLWNRVYAGDNWNLKPGLEPWEQNPYVWAISFRRVTP